jgi:hypothetical protein
MSMDSWLSRASRKLDAGDETAQVTLQRCSEISRLCKKGLDELPPSQRIRPLSTLQIVGYAVLGG